MLYFRGLIFRPKGARQAMALGRGAQTGKQEANRLGHSVFSRSVMKPKVTRME